MVTTPADATDPVRKLKELLRAKWPDACPLPATHRHEFPANRASQLGRLFGSAGSLRAQMLEITGGMAAGKTRLLALLLASLAPGGTIVYCDRPRALFPPALQAAGIDLQTIRIIHPASAAVALRQMELLCLAQAAAVAVLDLCGERERLPENLLHRLRRGAVKGGVAVIFLTAEAQLFPPSMLSLRVGVRRVSPTRVAATVLASRISPAGTQIELDFDA